MKKITLLLLGIFALIGSTMAQGAMSVNSVEFTSNPSKFNGKIISISNVKINPKGAVTPGVIATPGAVVTPGAGVSAPVAPGVIRCNPPRGFRSLDIDFVNDPTFNKCFFISEAQYNSLPKGQDGLNATITFKGDDKLGYTITLFKLQ